MELKEISLVLFIILVIIFIVVAKRKKSHLSKKEAPIETVNNSVLNYNNNFSFTIEDIFTMQRGGVVVVGNVEKGEIHAGDTVKIMDLGVEIATTKIIGIELFQQVSNKNILVDKIVEGQRGGIYLKGITKEQIKIGQILMNEKCII